MKRFALLLWLICLSAIATTHADPPKQITVGMDFDSAAALLRSAGARQGRFFDATYVNPPPKWDDFALPDKRTITLHASPSELFPNIFRVTAIFIVHPNESDLGKSNLKGDRKTERVEKFLVPEAASNSKPK